MWKIKLFVFLFLVFSFIVFSARSANAQTCSGSTTCCAVQPGDCICTSGGAEIGSCAPGSGGQLCMGGAGTCSCTLWCGNPTINTSCVGAGCGASCPSGYIVASTSCSGGGGGGGGATCPWSPVNCPVGTSIDTSQLLSTGCYQPTGCGSAGTAQTYFINEGNCCGTNSNGDCIRWNLNTYACVSPTVTNSDPIGFHDGSDCTASYGWTCDANDYETPINVDLYADGAGWGLGDPLGSVIANIVGGPELEPFCGGTRNHVFYLPTPTRLIDGLAHTIYAFAINNPVGNNPLLINSPKTFTCTPTCDVVLSGSTPLTIGANTILNASITSSLGAITQVNFSSDNSSVSVSPPGYDTSSSYTTTVTANSVGTATITANVIMAGAVRCSDSTTITVTNPGGWWQAKDGDITAENGSITSAVPSATYFNTDGAGGFPGVPTYYNGSLSYGSGLLSTKQWSANTQTTQSRRFDYSYFNNLIPSDFVSPTTYDGYVWTKINGPHTLSATDFTTSKNVLFVNGNLNITGNVALTDGTGFFLAIVSGNITVDPSITSLEGIYLTDGTFSTGTYGPDLDSQLQTRGSVASYSGISLQRDLTNNTQPAEVFTFAPDQIALFPEKLGFRRTRWTEVAP